MPPGFVVGAAAHALFYDKSGLRSRLSELLAGVDVDDTAALEAAAAEARSRVESEPVPAPG